MKTNRYISFFLLSIWIVILYDVSVVDFSKEYPLFKLKEEIPVTSPNVETTFDLVPGNYLLKIIYDAQEIKCKEVLFNGNKITSFKVHKTRNISEYFYIPPDQIQKNNLLKISLRSNFPRDLTVKLQNYRHMSISNNIVGFPRSMTANLIKFEPVQSAVVFLLSFSFLTTSMSLLKETSRKYLKKLVVVLGLILTTVVIIQVFPFVRTVFFMSPACFFAWWAWPLIISLLMIIRNTINFTNILSFVSTSNKKSFNNYKLSNKDIFNKETRCTNKRGFVFFVFLFLLLVLSVLRFYLVMDKRIPMGHDTFQYLQLQYNLFFNEPALNKTVPQWLPFMTHGTVSNLWLIFSQGIFVSVIVPIARFLKHINFYSIFQIGLLFDELILLFGCIALAKRYFKSAAATLFVASSIVFTTISSTQIWWDFHLLYLFPVTLYCFDRTFRETSAKYLFLACLFSVGMMLGNPPYCVPLFAFVMVVFGLSIWFFFPQQTSACLRQFVSSFKLRHLLAIIIPCILLLIIFLFMKYGTADIIPHNSKRAADWQVSGLRDFLNYGENVNLSKYLELVCRGTNNLDNTVYAGLLIMPFALLTFLRVRSRLSYAFGTTALIMVLFSAGIIIPVIFYYTFPLAKYYRHIGLIAPLVKLFIVFYAAFGFDRFWQALKCLCKETDGTLFVEAKVYLIILIMSMLLILSFISFQWLGGFRIFNFPSSTGSLKTINQLYTSESQISHLMAILMLLSGLFLILLTAMLWLPKKAVLLGWVLISIHLIDLVSFKAESEIKRLPRVDQEIVRLFDVNDYSFSHRRSQDYLSNNRFCKLAPYLFIDDQEPFEPNQPANMVAKYGVQYWAIDTFLFFDAVSHIFSTQRWLKGVDAFYRVWVPASDRSPGHASFPMPQSTAFKNLCGYSAPKLQLFSKIHVLPNEKNIAETLANPKFKGNMILTSDIDSKLSKTSNALLIDSDCRIHPPDNDERTRGADILVKEFALDKLRLQVNNKTTSDAVLYYADAWHPEWHAYVNSKPSTVLKTNLAYKSVIIPPGKSEVVFEFGDDISIFLFNSMITIGIVVFCGFCYCLFIGLIEKDESLNG